MNRRFYLFKKLWIGGDCEGLVFVRLDAFSHDSLLPMYHLPLEPCFPDFTLCYILQNWTPSFIVKPQHSPLTLLTNLQKVNSVYNQMIYLIYDVGRPKPHLGSYSQRINQVYNWSPWNHFKGLNLLSPKQFGIVFTTTLWMGLALILFVTIQGRLKSHLGPYFKMTSQGEPLEIIRKDLSSSL